MIIEIEYYKGDTILYGKHISFHEFKNQLKAIEAVYDREEDNFVALLCRRFNWSVCSITERLQPEYVYDRDIEKAYKIYEEANH